MTPPELRWGLIGCGDISEKRVAPALGAAAASRLVAVARARPELAADFAARHGAARWHADWRQLVQDVEIDAVYVATPVRLHAAQAIAAARAGKHVLVEKPMALSVAECDAMIAAARDAGVSLGVAYYRHLYPAVARLRVLLGSGELGSPVLAQVQAFEHFDPPAGHPRAWLLDPAQSGGGPMMDFGCHRIEILLDLLGPVSQVRGFPARVRFHERSVEDTCVAHFRFDRGGEAVLSVSHAARESRDAFQLFGSEGSAHLEPLSSGRLRILARSGEREELHPPHPNLHQPIVEDFVAAVAKRRAPAVPGETGLAVNRLLAAIYDSGQGRAPISRGST